jgi:hypothetical protein
MTEILVSPTDQTVLYMSRRAELRLTMVPRYPKLNQVTGAKQGETKGAFIGFRDGQVRIPKTGEYVTVDTLDGGESEPMPSPEVHEWLSAPSPVRQPAGGLLARRSDRSAGVAG